MWQGPFVLEHLAEIAAIDPAIAGRAADEMVGLVCRRVAETHPAAQISLVTFPQDGHS
jgi:hypothetical protein